MHFRDAPKARGHHAHALGQQDAGTDDTGADALEHAGREEMPSARPDGDGRDEPLRAERDAALEEAAFLREQLDGIEIYYAQLLNEERTRRLAERRSLLGTIDVLAHELRLREQREHDRDDDGASAPATERAEG